MSRPNIFISYCHDDEKWLDKLCPYLTPLEKEFNISIWHDKKIPTGSQWRDELEEWLDSAVSIVCLLSQSYLTSSFIQEKEWPKIQEQMGKGRKVLPICASPCTIPGTPFERIQWAIPDDKSLAEMEETEWQRWFAQINKDLKELLKETRKQLPPLTSPSLLHPNSSPDSVARYNIVVVGKTGVGKSALINYLFGEKLRDSGVGKPVTSKGFHRQDFAIKGIHGTLFDSWGLEISTAAQWREGLEVELSKRGTDKPAEEWFHTIFYCVAASSGRIEDFEIDIIKRFMRDKNHVVLVFTKADLAARQDLAHLEETVQSEFDVALPCVAVCNERKELLSGWTKPFGAKELTAEIFRGFWESISIRLPARCISLIMQEIRKWAENAKDYAEKETGYFNHEKILQTIQIGFETFVKGDGDSGGILDNILRVETKRTVRVYQEFEQLLDYSLAPGGGEIFASVGNRLSRLTPDNLQNVGDGQGAYNRLAPVLSMGLVQLMGALGVSLSSLLVVIAPFLVIGTVLKMREDRKRFINDVTMGIDTTIEAMNTELNEKLPEMEKTVRSLLRV